MARRALLGNDSHVFGRARLTCHSSLAPTRIGLGLPPVRRPHADALPNGDRLALHPTRLRWGGGVKEHSGSLPFAWAEDAGSTPARSTKGLGGRLVCRPSTRW